MEHDRDPRGRPDPDREVPGLLRGHLGGRARDGRLARGPTPSRCVGGSDRPDDPGSRPSGGQRAEHRTAGEHPRRRPGGGLRVQRQHRVRLGHEGRAARRAADRPGRLRGRPGGWDGEHDPRAVPARPDADGIPDGQRHRARRDVPRRSPRSPLRSPDGGNGGEPRRSLRALARGAGRVRPRIPGEGGGRVQTPERPRCSRWRRTDPSGKGTLTISEDEHPRPETTPTGWRSSRPCSARAGP